MTSAPQSNSTMATSTESSCNSRTTNHNSPPKHEPYSSHKPSHSGMNDNLLQHDRSCDEATNSGVTSSCPDDQPLLQNLQKLQQTHNSADTMDGRDPKSRSPTSNNNSKYLVEEYHKTKPSSTAQVHDRNSPGQLIGASDASPTDDGKQIGSLDYLSTALNSGVDRHLSDITDYTILSSGKGTFKPFVTF